MTVGETGGFTIGGKLTRQIYHRSPRILPSVNEATHLTEPCLDRYSHRQVSTPNESGVGAQQPRMRQGWGSMRCCCALTPTSQNEGSG